MELDEQAFAKAQELAQHLHGITSSVKNGALSMYQIEEAEFCLREWWGMVGKNGEGVSNQE